MLQRLHIRNYAIIQDIQIAFHPHFNIITGETGAGKSILVGALGLVLGNRADLGALYNSNEKCVVEASFLPAEPEKFSTLFAEHDLDEATELVVRREIGTNGKSRSFINDTPVTLQVLRLFATRLVDLHQQFDTLELGNDDFQRNVLDALAGNQDLMAQYQKSYGAYEKSAKLLLQLQQQQAEAQKHSDYNSFLLQELNELNLQPQEMEQMEAEQALLSNAESIKAVLEMSTFTLKNSEQPLVQQLKTLAQQLQSLRSTHPGILEATERLKSAQIELQDLAQELELINDHINVDAAQLQTVNDRLALGYKLMKKHQATHADDLLRIQAELVEQLARVENIDQQLTAAGLERQQLHAAATKLAKQLSHNRNQQLAFFETATNKLLAQVGMPNAQLKVRLQPAAELQTHGADEVTFLFDGNKTGRFEPLEKVASGGELSRLMLSIKSLVANSMQMPTLIFDEIDSGISGEAARQVGIIMKQLAQHRQIIAITHQPQIAAGAQAHFYVYKKETNGQINTQLRLLNTNERIDAIAAMLSGDEHTASSKKMAKDMMGL
ncbi:MAG: DNA repair protein RecN [Bacteroidetes bacterium]|nr:MAG: DNA repair protein RecN [Bacteroidota bacterium]